jgi:hypothetical protein
MTVTPLTNVTAGSVWTAAQVNVLPRGLMTEVVTSTTTDSSITAEEVELTITWTAEANRLYRIRYIEPALSCSSNTTCTARLRQTNISGTVLNSTTIGIPSTLLSFVGLCEAVQTIAAGSQTVVATLQFSAGTGVATRSSTRFPMLTVEDVGAA